MPPRLSLSPWIALWLLGCAPEAVGVVPPTQRVAPPLIEQPDCSLPLLIAHRGTRQAAPENTLEAFRWAADHGADGLEIDVRMTADGVLVALHDRGVGRTTDHPGDAAVSALTLAELQQLDAGAWFDPSFAGARVPTLEAILGEFARSELLYVFDIKDASVIEPLVELLAAHSASGRAIFASGDLAVLDALHTHVPGVPALYFLESMDEVESLALPTLHYLRVPKEAESEPLHTQRIAAAGYGAVTSARYLSWASAETTLTALALADHVARSFDRREQRRPPACDGE